MSKLSKGLEIIEKYVEEKNCFFGAEHDVIYFYVSPGKVSTEDKKALEELGFNASEDDDNFFYFT